MILLFLLSHFFAFCAWSAQSTPTPARNLIIFELHSPDGYQQSSLEWNEKELTYITNSNFTQASHTKALLGIFHAPLLDPTKKQLAAITQNSKNIKLNKNSKSLHHRIEVKFEGNSIPVDSKQYSEILELMQTESQRGDWKAEDGLSIELNAKQEPQIKVLSEKLKQGPTQATCAKKGMQKILCKVRPYGVVQFDIKK